MLSKICQDCHVFYNILSYLAMSEYLSVMIMTNYKIQSSI